LIDPLDKISEIFDVRVDNLIQVLQPTEEEIQLTLEMSVGQRNYPLCFDA